MSSKRKWDQAAPADAEAPAKAPKTEEGKTASEAAAAAAAIAAKIAAQFANAPTSGSSLGPRDPHDGDYTHDIDINDVRNRYLLTKGATQTQIHEETGASVSTKGVWYPDRTKATEKDPPLYLHISATDPEMLQKAIDKVNELISMDMGSLVEDKKDRMREKRKWPEEKIPVALETIRNFNVRAKVVGPSGMFVKYIQQETGTRVQIKGQGSGFVDQETGQEHDEPMFIHVTGPDEGQVQRAKALTEDLLDVVRQEYNKVKAIVTQQQMELHQAQAQYAAYSAYSGYAPPQPGAAPPPPPPGEQPPPPPDGGAPPPPGEQPTHGAAPSANDTDAYAAYWAAYGYDVNSPEFKAWQAQQQQQYAQYYAQAGYGGAAATGVPGQDGVVAPPPSEPAPPPPPPA
ncbi:KH-domain containing protein [Phanerochaete sordida]|uniref:KH-domain containing protein n=1 Tax=Phanerochaete sordida TaxID=48140 RepID=A0A9P3G1V4_9APHY|nr:KH-domain containing protein [Phanerochaete sordida]